MKNTSFPTKDPKQGYAKRFEEGFKANLTLETKFELYLGQNKLNQGWALKSCKSRSPFSEKQKEFLDEIFKEGKQTGVKANPDTVVLTTRKARNDQNKHLLQVSKGLISQQVASYFGRKKASQNPEVANRQQYPCSTCFKYNLNMKTKEKLLRMSTKEMHSIGNIPMIMANIASTTLFKGKKNGAQKSRRVEQKHAILMMIDDYIWSEYRQKRETPAKWITWLPLSSSRL